MQVRIHRAPIGDSRRCAGSISYRYFDAPISARRAIELVAEQCAAECCTDVDYFEAIDDCYEYDAPGCLIADWTGRPAITLNADVLTDARYAR